MGRNDSKEQELKQNKSRTTKAGLGNPKLEKPDRPAT